MARQVPSYSPRHFLGYVRCPPRRPEGFQGGATRILSNIVDEVAMPLLLNLRQHIPIHIRRLTFSKMERQYLKRIEAGDALVDKELIAIVQEAEAHLREMRAADQVPDPWPTEKNEDISTPSEGPLKPPRPMAQRLQRPGNIEDRLGQCVPENEGPETRACHKCK